MKQWFKNMLLWLVKGQLPRVVKWAIDSIPVDRWEEKVREGVQYVRDRLPDGYAEAFNNALGAIYRILGGLVNDE